MQRFINNPDDVVDEIVRGYLLDNKHLETLPNNSRVVKKKKIPKRVSLVSGGGSGHEPSFIGYIRPGMLDAAAIGEIFSSPTAKSFKEAFEAADQGKGVACIFGNYSGDNMNVKSAIMDAEDEGIKVKSVVSRDDIASAPKSEKDRRHGIAGLYYMWLVAGKVAEQGGSLEEVCAAAQRAADNTASICVGLKELTIPAVGHPNFKIPDGKYELGIGHHGEPGLEKYTLSSSNEIAKKMVGELIEDLDISEKTEVAIMLSGLGSTPIGEQYILFQDVMYWLKKQDIKVVSTKVGNLVTSLNMNGAALTILKLDSKLKEWLINKC